MNMKISIIIFSAALYATCAGLYFLAEIGFYVTPKFMQLVEEYPLAFKFVTLISVTFSVGSLWFNLRKNKHNKSLKHRALRALDSF